MNRSLETARRRRRRQACRCFRPAIPATNDIRYLLPNRPMRWLGSVTDAAARESTISSDLGPQSAEVSDTDRTNVALCDCVQVRSCGLANQARSTASCHSGRLDDGVASLCPSVFLESKAATGLRKAGLGLLIVPIHRFVRLTAAGVQRWRLSFPRLVLQRRIFLLRLQCIAV